MGLGLWSMLIRVLKILISLEDLMGEVVKLLGNKQPGRDNLGERDVSKALEISGANTPDNGSSVDGASVNSGDQEKSL